MRLIEIDKQKYIISAHVELVSKRLQELDVDQTGEINEITIIPDRIIFFYPTNMNDDDNEFTSTHINFGSDSICIKENYKDFKDIYIQWLKKK